MVPLCPAPKLKAPEVELGPGAATLSPKPPPAAGAADAPNVKGDGVELPNTEPLVPLGVVWVVAPKPEVVAAPNEKMGVVPPKAGWVLAGAPKAEAVVFKPKADCAEPPKAGWAVAGAADGAGAAEFPKVNELPKLGARAGLEDPCCCPSAAPNVGCGVADGYAGRAGLALGPKGMLNAGVVVLLKVRVGWLVVAAGAEVVREPPKPLKPAVLPPLPLPLPPVLVVATSTAPGKDWPKVVTAVDAGVTVDLPNWNTEPTAGAKLAAEAGGAPKGKG